MYVFTLSLGLIHTCTLLKGNLCVVHVYTRYTHTYAQKLFTIISRIYNKGDEFMEYQCKLSHATNKPQL